VWDDAPSPLRESVYLLLKDYVEVPVDTANKGVARALLLPTPKSSGSVNTAWASLRLRLDTCKWFEFYNACEFIYEELLLTRGYRGTASRYEIQLNDLLAHHGIGWRMKAGKLERSISAPVDEEIQKAMAILTDERFAGPNEQFQRAIISLSQRPNPNAFDCINSAVGAMEGVARILSGKPTAILSQIIHKEPFSSRIHGALREAIEKVYAYRGALGGVTHGQVELSPASVEDAEFVLGLCASTIIYMVKKVGSSS